MLPALHMNSEYHGGKADLPGDCIVHAADLVSCACTAPWTCFRASNTSFAHHTQPYSQNCLVHVSKPEGFKMAPDLHLLGCRGGRGCEGGVKVQQGCCSIWGETLTDRILIRHRRSSAAWNLCMYNIAFRGHACP